MLHVSMALFWLGSSLEIVGVTAIEDKLQARRAVRKGGVERSTSEGQLLPQVGVEDAIVKIRQVARLSRM